MKKQKSLPNESRQDDSNLDALVKALVATPEAKAMIKESGVNKFEDLVGKDGLVAKMLKPFMQEVLNCEMNEHLGYSKHEFSGYGSGNNRNGSYKRTLRSSDGPFTIDMPRDRNGNFASAVVPPYKQISSDLEQKIIYLYAIGTSTADIAEFIYETYGVEMSQGFISSVTEKILSLAKEWQLRPLNRIYTVVYLDAIHVKCRENNKVINKAVHIVMAYDTEGRKDILGHYISSGPEGSKFWLSVITDLKNRGVTDILIACVDGLSGFEKAINSIYPQAIVQRCVIHAIRSSMAYIPHKLKSEFMEYLRPVYTAATLDEAKVNFSILEDRYGEKYPIAVNVWKNNWNALTQYFAFSPEIRTLVYTTNPIESYNSVLRKYTKNKRSFVSDEALQKVLYLATQKAQERWSKCIPNWPAILNQLAIHFEDRLKLI